MAYIIHPHSTTASDRITKSHPSHANKGKSRTGPNEAARLQTEQDIRRKLALLANIARPLSPTLPPSPPLSPRPSKRKSPEPRSSGPSTAPEQSAKRPRVSDKPKEDGELDEQPPTPGPSRPPPPSPPITRPRRKLTEDQLKIMANKTLGAGRELKHSGDKRVAAPPTSRRNIIRLLEHTDGLLHFVYGFWCQDEARTSSTDPWMTLDGFAMAVRTGWDKFSSSTEATPDQVVMGRIFLGFTLLLKFCAEHRTNRRDTRRLRAESAAPATITGNGGSSAVSPANTASSHPTPPSTMNSTPLQPPIAPSPASSASSNHHLNPHHARGHGSHSQSPPQQVTVSPSFVTRVNKTLNTSAELQNLLAQANRFLNLYDLRTHFPHTYNICAGNNASTGRPLTTGAPSDAMQVDFDACIRGKGEWAWPITSGDDVAHAVGFGRSLVWEMGLKEGGYLGLEGIHRDGPKK